MVAMQFVGARSPAVNAGAAAPPGADYALQPLVYF
jgi:hypothetical protein